MNSHRELLSPRFERQAGSAVRLGRDQRALTSTVSDKLNDGTYRMIADPCPCGRPGADVLLVQLDTDPPPGQLGEE